MLYKDSSSLKSVIIPIGVLLLNFLLKNFYIETNDIAMDEPFSIFNAQKSVGEIISFLSTGNNPPLYEIILHFWIKLFGIGVFSVRFPSLLFSSLTSISIYFIALKFWNWRVAVISALIFTFSTFHIYFAHEARVYALFALLTSLSVLFYLKFIERTKSLKYFVLLLLINTLLIYAHYLGLIVILSELLFCFLHRKNIISLKIVLFNYLILGLLFLPIAFVFIERFYAYSYQGTWVGTPSVSELYENIRKFSNAPVIAVCVIVLLLISIILNIKNRDIILFPTKFLIWLFLFSYIGLFIFSQISSVFLDRYLIFTSIPFYLLIGVSMDYVLKTNILKIAGFLIIICAMLYTVNLKPSNNNQIKDAVLYILNKKKENTKIIVTPDWTDLTIMYYYNRSIFADYTHLYQNMKKENLFPTNDIETVKALIQNKDSDIIYTDMGSKFVDKENKIYELLKSSFPQKEDKLFKGVKIIHFYY